MKRRNDMIDVLLALAAIAIVLLGWAILTRSVAAPPEPVSPADKPRMRAVHGEPEPAPEPAETVPLYLHDPRIPLSQELQRAFHVACIEGDVPEALALGLIQVESCFQEDADNGQCYGLCQLNRAYFPGDLSPADNLREGMGYLGRLLRDYRDVPAALTAYHCGHDTGARGYASAVLEAAEWWEEYLREDAERR